MASRVAMAEPVCLLENSPSRGLVVQQEALELLSEVTQPVVVVAITGPYRSGKSYLMNRLAAQRKGFSLGSTVQSHTRGIWMWCVAHPCQPGHTLVLLDTEGLGDTEKGDTRNDTWIFVLTLLLSSTLMYNSRGTIDQQALDQLHYVLTLSEHIRLKAGPRRSEDELEDSEKFASFFPTFVWLVRDFTLQLELDGKEISEDQYLENALKLRAESTPETQGYNRTRECIRRFFAERKCFVFDVPARRKDLAHLEEVEDERLDPRFLQQLETFCSYIWEKAPVKRVPGGHIVTGKLLGKLAASYVEVIRSGAVPCLESTVMALAKAENAAAVEEAVRLYRDLMEQRVELPTETLEELLELHARCEREALELFLARAFQEEMHCAQAELMRQVEAVKKKFCKANEKVSRDKCEAALRDLFQELDKRIGDGVYSVPGGYELFRGHQQVLVDKYMGLRGKGLKAPAVLHEFLQSRQTLAQSILKADLSLTEMEKQKKIEEERNRRAEQERELQRKKDAEEKVKLQDQLRSKEEHVLQLKKSLEAACEKKLEEQDKMIRHRRQEERALRQEGFEDKAEQMNGVIRKLEEEISVIEPNYAALIEMGLSLLVKAAFLIYRTPLPVMERMGDQFQASPQPFCSRLAAMTLGALLTKFIQGWDFPNG
ncbi:guanylate-binding protein 1-like isoform X2 [Heliangelus exortis]|uniref:guanylate-binding protein 1-like isoform X2 n=1 Tax=Heliangelus exortis TaxID=472823 RepID=UPI003A8F07DB